MKARANIWSLFLGSVIALSLASCTLDNPSKPVADNPWDPNNPSPPRAPTDLTGEVLSETSIKLQWRDMSGNETGFLLAVYAVGTDSLHGWIEHPHPYDSLAANDTATIITNLRPATNYDFVICAFNKANISAPSNSLTLSTAEVIPNPPTNATLTPVNGTNLLLRWEDRSANEAHFEVLAGTDSAHLEKSILLPRDSTSCLIRNLDPFTLYYCRVRAVNSFGASAQTPIRGAEPGNLSLSAPSHLVAEVISESEISLTWADTELAVESFQIWQSMDDSAHFDSTGLAPIQVPVQMPVHVSVRVPGHDYYYRVVAQNRFTSSSTSNIARASTREVAPFAPSDFRATIADELDIIFDWTDNSHMETGYELDSCVGELREFTIIDTLPANSTSYRLINCTPEIPIFYRLRALGPATPSNWVSCPAVTVSLNPPSNLTASIVNELDVSLSWADNSARETGYELSERLGDSSHYAVIDTLAADAHSFRLNDQMSGQKYFYRIRALCTNGASALASCPFVIPGAVAPNAPTNFEALPISDTEILLRWQDESRIESNFVLQEKLFIGGDFQNVTSTDSNVGQCSLTGKLPNTSYTYRVRATNQFGGSAWAGPMNVTTPGPPPRPIQLSAQGIDSSGIMLNWRMADGDYTPPLGYVVEDSLEGIGGYSLVDTARLSESYWCRSVDSPYLRHFYRVQSYNKYGNSGWSNLAGAFPLRQIAFVACYDAGLTEVDVTNPANPSLIRTVDTPGLAMRVAIEGERAYVADSYGGVEVFDISSPALMAQIGSFNTDGRAYGLAINNSIAYVAQGDSGVVIIDFTNVNNPVRLSHLSASPGIAMNLFLKGNDLFVAAQGRGVLRIGVSNPHSPSIVNEVATGSSTQGICVSSDGQHALTAEYAGGMRVYDLPGLAYNEAAIDGLTLDVVAKEQICYVAEQHGIAIVDFSAAPQVNDYRNLGSVLGLGIYGNWLYACNGNLGMKILDIQQAAAPQEVGSFITPGPARGVAVREYK